MRLNFVQLNVFHTCDLILYAENCIFFIDVFTFIALSDNFLSRAAFGSQDPNTRVFSRIATIESIELGLENTVWLCTLSIQSCFHSTCGVCRSFISGNEVKGGLSAIGR